MITKQIYCVTILKNYFHINYYFDSFRIDNDKKNYEICYDARLLKIKNDKINFPRYLLFYIDIIVVLKTMCCF